MQSLKSALAQIRVLHGVFVVTWFLFVFVTYRVAPPPHDMPPVFPEAIGLVCLMEISLAFYLRLLFIGRSLERLRIDQADINAIGRWRSGNVLSFVFAETVTLFGLALKFVGADWRIAAPFFVAGLLLLLIWFPRLDFEPA